MELSRCSGPSTVGRVHSYIGKGRGAAGAGKRKGRMFSYRRAVCGYIAGIVNFFRRKHNKKKC